MPASLVEPHLSNPSECVISIRAVGLRVGKREVWWFSGHTVIVGRGVVVCTIRNSLIPNLLVALLVCPRAVALFPPTKKHMNGGGRVTDRAAKALSMTASAYFDVSKAFEGRLPLSWAARFKNGLRADAGEFGGTPSF